jgi:hypothetical protein
MPQPIAGREASRDLHHSGAACPVHLRHGTALAMRLRRIRALSKDKSDLPPSLEGYLASDGVPDCRRMSKKLL